MLSRFTHSFVSRHSSGRRVKPRARTSGTSIKVRNQNLLLLLLLLLVAATRPTKLVCTTNTRVTPWSYASKHCYLNHESRKLSLLFHRLFFNDDNQQTRTCAIVAVSDVSVRLSRRWWWCYYSLLLLLDMSSWPRWESRWYSRCSWALTGPRGSIGNDTALSDTDYDRTAERRLTPPLASHQQRCHITPESQSDKSSATDVQVRRSLRSWCWRATDCSIRFVLSSSFYLAILPRYTVVVALVVVCSVLSCPILSVLSCLARLVPFLSILCTRRNRIRWIKSFFALPRLVTDSPSLLQCLHSYMVLSNTACCVATTRVTLGNWSLAIVATIDCGFGRCIEIHRNTVIRTRTQHRTNWPHLLPICWQLC